jgi:hypothetical protein
MIKDITGCSCLDQNRDLPDDHHQAANTSFQDGLHTLHGLFTVVSAGDGKLPISINLYIEWARGAASIPSASGL